MAATVQAGYPANRNTRSLLSFLSEDDVDSRVYALQNLAKNVDYMWHELIDHIEFL